MLSKSVCKRCVNRAYSEHEKGVWDKKDEFYWEKGKVFCPKEYNKIAFTQYWDVEKEPHEYCPYKLEHLVME